MGLSPSTHEPTPSANRPARSRRTLVLAASLACAAACAAWLCAPHGPARQIDTVGGAGSPGPTAGLSSSEGCLGVRRFIAAFDRQTGHPSNASNKKAATSCRTPKSPGATDSFRFPIQLCQALGPAAPWAIRGVDCAAGCGCGWESARLIQWQQFAQGEYCGPARTEHVPEYRLRVDDELDLVYRLTREEQPNPYQLNVGDEIRVESATDPDLDRDLLIQPDGTITLRLLGQVRATGRTIPQLRDEIEQFYTKYYKGPAITVSPLRVNSKLDDLRNAVDSRFGQGGQNRSARVTPEGTISLPAIGVVQAQGLTLQELRVELREAYRKEVEGIEVIPVLVSRAPRYVYVLGEVNTPGRYELTGPTTLMQALAMAGSWRVGAQLRQVVVFRRGDDWRLLATMLDIRPALYAKQPCPPAEIWLSDADVIVVPKHPILVADEFIELVFTCGIYGVFPMNVAVNFSKLSTL
ncbi:MAG: polysaccharide biosynthesis/export family protein [Pirellulales bacterium]|nr:polysaccharide biosynthesis/export family protein [Pirellulales bacterium]